MPPLTRLFAAPALALGLALAAPAPLLAGTSGPLISTAVDGETLSAAKKTKAGLYITAEETIALLAERDDIVLIDVRTPEETMFVGYATATDMNIPFRLIDPAHSFNADRNAYDTMANPAFIDDVKALIEARNPATLMVMCRSGARSARAVDALVKAGIDIPSYSVIDGFEGDRDEEGARTVNGWRNVGGDWTYAIRADLMPARQ